MTELSFTVGQKVSFDVRNPRNGAITTLEGMVSDATLVRGRIEVKNACGQVFKPFAKHARAI
ncbi:hypothetical protein [Magnetospirillum molischianum]|uniref:Uncharacterized protein n=1 Tax=Magnetospirillum molischianum DSM 120 TaxID=1150626 RepID=H8FY98_MAGML|nr:hypothetical protein [Magnetospirillum molischianum]CCG43336.1 hypothetical protein PHAMO_80127 [Magnetospirillum molischianum DSM 120]